MASDKRAQGRKNQCTLAHLTDKQRVALWDKEKCKVKELKDDQDENSTPCHIWTGSTQNGYPAISQGHGKSKLKVHILASWIKHRSLPQEKEVTSHLCHRKTCINPDHLVIESIASNNARKGCLKALQVENGKIFNLCWHDPPCMRRDEATLGTFVPTMVFDSAWFAEDFVVKVE
jgi:hypothetical protein